MRPASPVWSLLLVLGTLGLPQGALAQDTAPRYFFEGDMVRGPVSGTSLASCVLTSQFKRNEPIVWRVRVIDAKTGRAVDDKALKSLVVVLPDGQKFPARFGPHPKGKNEDFFWTVSWRIPADYPTGTLGYKVIATGADGQPTTWEPFKVSLSQLTIVP